MLSANRIEEVIKNCQALIQQKSYSGQEGEVVNAIKTMMQHYQFDDGNDSNLLIVFYVQIMPDDFVMQLHRF